MRQKITEVIWIYPLGTINVCIKFQGNPSNNFQDSSLKVKNVNLMVVLDEKPGDHQSVRFILWGPRMSVKKKKIHGNLIVVEIFNSGPKQWTTRPTGIAIYRPMLLALLKKRFLNLNTSDVKETIGFFEHLDLLFFSN